MDICADFKCGGKAFEQFCPVVQYTYLPAVGREYWQADGIFPIFRVGNVVVPLADRGSHMDSRENCKKDRQEMPVQWVSGFVPAGGSPVFPLRGKLWNSSEELEEACMWLTGEIAGLSGKVERGEDGGMELNIPAEENAVKAMKGLSQEYPELTGYFPKPKELVNSCILSIQNLTGVYSPFTIEANYNGDVQDYVIPFTACHELSHLRGFMQEQEANFIAFLACSKSGEDAFAYSGYLSGWIQCMNVLYKTDYDAWKEVRGTLPPEAEADLRLNREFWAKYDGAIAEVSNKVNDTYLKANGQKDGVKSYNRMVDLIVAYYHSEVR